jgi:class 3 adenylate cyclase
MANRLIAPSLADIDQDIAGLIPVDVIIRWSTGKKNVHTHKEVLAPYTIKGTVVSSDSAGLSKLTQNKTLAEVMKLVSEPKEVIFKYGKSIGGEAIGVWAADNTQMFYDDSIPQDEIVTQMISAQQEAKDLSVKVGIGIHSGNFINLGGGLFGKDADFIEELAENHTEGREIFITEEVKKKLSSKLAAALREKKVTEMQTTGYSLEYEKLKVVASKSRSVHYPYPFTKDFFHFLQSYNPTQPDLTTYLKYSKEKIVILVKVLHAQKEFLLDQLSEWVLANIILKKITRLNEIEEIKSNGSLGIFVTENATQAVEFATDLKDTLSANGYTVNVGVTQGEVLIFPISKGVKDIAGGPVNIASKLAEDSGENGKVLIQETVKLKKDKLPDHKPFSLKISSVELRGIYF